MGLNLEEMSTPSTERLTLLQVAASSGMAEMIKALADEDEDLDAKDCCRAAAVQPKAEQSFERTSRGSEWTTGPGRMAPPKTWLKGVFSPLRPRPAPGRHCAQRLLLLSLLFGELGLPPPLAHHREHEQAVAVPLPLRHVLLDISFSGQPRPPLRNAAHPASVQSANFAGAARRAPVWTTPW